MKKKSTFFNILVSYLIIMVTPMVLLGAMLFNFFYNTYDNEIIDNRINSLHRMQIIMDNIINEMNANAYTMFNSQEFSTSYLEEQYGNFYDTVHKLCNITFASSFINDTFYVNNQTKRVYTAKTMYDYNEFCKYNLNYNNNILGEQLPDLFIQDLRSYWIPLQDNGSEKVLTYVSTNKVSNNSPNASAIFQIDKSTLDELMGEFISDNHSCVIISDINNNILYTTNEEISNLSWEMWKHSNVQQGQKSVKFKVKHDTYIAFQQVSTKSNVNYVSIVPYQSLTRPIAFQRNLFFVGIILIAILCTFFISRFMKINYASVRSISKMVNSLVGNSGEAANTDTEELENTKQVLIAIKERDLKTLRNNLTLKLLRNGFTDHESFQEECIQTNYNLLGPYFVVIIFQIEEYPQMKIDSYQKIAKFIEDTLNVYVDCYPLIYPESKSIFIVASGDDEELSNLNVKLVQIKKIIENEFSIFITIGVGNKAEIANVADSYSQASIACEYKFITGKYSITFFENIDKGYNTKIVYPTREIDILYHAILQGDGEGVQFAMQNLINHILSMKSLFYCTCLAYDILNTAMKAMRELNCTVTELKEIDIIKTGVIKSIDDIAKIVDIISKKIADVLSQQKEMGEDAVPVCNFEQILKYISANYNTDIFSVECLASHFNMSISNFSHYFKNHTNQTVSEYISLLRFEKAKEYLRTTDMNLQDVAAMCGYLHISTFMRQFKQREECTPASYRSKYRR